MNLEKSAKFDAENSSLDEDFVTKAAKDAFGISYLYPWQRIVISNILEAAGIHENPQEQNENDSENIPPSSIHEDINPYSPEDESEKETDDVLFKEFISAQKENSPVEDTLESPIPEFLDYSPTKERGKKTFLSKAEETQDAPTAENMEKDVFCLGRQIVLLPTGAGKSLCFLTPALLLPGPTLVLYPLLALMADQQRRMEEGGLKSVVFKGGQTPEEREEAFRKLKDGAKIILANPEVLQSKTLVEKLSQFNISHIAIDEAHCVSEWGDSFRPAYLTLGDVIKKLNCPVITAFTATASPPVLNRVAQVLFDGKAHLVQSDSDRPNIRYSVINAFDKKKAAFKLAFTEQKPLIIFCGTRNKSEDMARELGLIYGRNNVKFYHAGLEKSEKNAVEKWFYEKDDGILCCTCAYGMGVDKKNIRTVIHLEPSPTAESYIQEAGRGGRDGGISKAILLWSPEDARKARKSKTGSRARVLATFAESKTCRRKVLLNALGDSLSYCAGCDVCERGAESPFAEDATYVLNILHKNRRCLTLPQASSKIMMELNSKDAPLFKNNIWDNKDISEILKSLKKEGFARTCLWPWKGLLTTGQKGKRISGFYYSDFYKSLVKAQRQVDKFQRKVKGIKKAAVRILNKTAAD